MLLNSAPSPLTKHPSAAIGKSSQDRRSGIAIMPSAKAYNPANQAYAQEKKKGSIEFYQRNPLSDSVLKPTRVQ